MLWGLSFDTSMFHPPLLYLNTINSHKAQFVGGNNFLIVLSHFRILEYWNGAFENKHMDA